MSTPDDAPPRTTPVHLLERMHLDPVTQEPRPRSSERSLAADVVALQDAAGNPVDRGKLTRAQKHSISEASLREPKPAWLKVRLAGGGQYQEVARIARSNSLHTVCEEARCPNIGECWGKGTATFQILGDVCTRACRYCAVATGRPDTAPDPLEPGKLSNAIERMGIKHAVITSVDRDDLPDRGAEHWAQTITAIRRRTPEVTIEVLTPDFMGVEEASLQTVMLARPDVFAHNTETVPRLYRRIRPKGEYQRAMWVLRRAKEIAQELGQPPLMTKTGVIAGMGETMEEIRSVMRDVRAAGVAVMSIGQFLRPTKRHLPVDRYVTPAEFDALHDYGMSLGFGSVFAGPLVRSSYKAEEQHFAASNPAANHRLTSGAPPVDPEDLAAVGVVPAWKA